MSCNYTIIFLEIEELGEEYQNEQDEEDEQDEMMTSENEEINKNSILTELESDQEAGKETNVQLANDVSLIIKDNRLSTPKQTCLLYTSPSPRDATLSRMPSSA